LEDWSITKTYSNKAMTAVAAKRSRIAQENEFVNSYATATYVNSILKLTFRDNDMNLSMVCIIFIKKQIMVM
jgi:hypothetical protein